MSVAIFAVCNTAISTTLVSLALEGDVSCGDWEQDADAETATIDYVKGDAIDSEPGRDAH